MALTLLISLPDEEQSLDVLAKELSFSPNEIELAKSLYSKGLPPLANPLVLPFLFGISHQLIGLMQKRTEKFYRSFEIKKSGGGVRTIKAPRRFIKTIQRWIYDSICSKSSLADYVIGFVKKKNIFTNADIHCHNGNLMVIDIQDFFPTIRQTKVEGVFSSFGFPMQVTKQLAALCCLNGNLPQGAPTSPTLANLVFREADAELSALATNWNCKYSRYADDLAFSGARKFNGKDMEGIYGILTKHGFMANTKKSRIIGRGRRQIIAGLVVNDKALPPRKIRRRWRATFHRASKHPEEFTKRERKLHGIAAFVNQYSRIEALKYREVAKKINQKGTD